MITLSCAKCGTTLRVDDGFAGGVCRCSRCGTIQTVPTTSTAGPASSTTSNATAKPAGQPLYERTGRADGTDRDLAQLGEIVTSSGMIGSSGLVTTRGSGTRRPRDPTVDDFAAGPPPRAAWPIVLTIIAAALVAAGVGVGLYLGGSRQNAASTDTTNSSSNDPTAPVPTGPRFATVRLTELSPVIYLIDRDSMSRELMPSIRAAVLRSAGTLRPPRTFQIRVVAPPGEPFRAFPAGGPQQQSPAALLDAGHWFDETPAAQPVNGSDVAASIEAALATKPGEVVFITGDAARLDDAFTDRATTALKRSPEVRFHALAVGTKAGAAALQTLADQSHGQLIVVLNNAALSELVRR